MFYNTSDNYEYNDCVSKGACSISPAISSMQEIMFVLLRQMAYYLIKLKGFGIIKEEITKNTYIPSSFDGWTEGFYRSSGSKYFFLSVFKAD